MVTVAAQFTETRESYGRELRSAVRGLWTGALSAGDFADAMEAAVGRGLTQAWHEGAEVMGVEPDELTQKELAALDDMISGEESYIGGFADAIRASSKANGGSLAPLLSRAELWLNRYDEAKARAMTMAGGNSKLEWKLGATEQHCTSCLRLSGKVKRASEWADYGVLPQSRDLACGGWNCDCELLPTTKRMSRGALPEL